MSIMLGTYDNITERQANYYDKVATDSLFSNIDVISYYTRSEVDAIDDELSSLILNICTKAEIDSQLTGYTTVAYLQGSCMTTLYLDEYLCRHNTFC